ncbi:uncharacterized protein LOC133734613 [Rosa rugosa]|uniref:uncharacterized protein LOC133734613 n=1 Tax=Rosa rugosa TaxID=74645 RepID=UPI002B409C43|nr:uncharacterized protein LOC133734613 [Rosa rugosa]
MAPWIAATSQLANMTRLSSPKSVTNAKAVSLLQRRGLAGGADHHGPPKVNFWEDPLSPSKWKKEHFLTVSLAGWGLLIYGGYKLFTGDKVKKESKKEEITVREVPR